MVWNGYVLHSKAGFSLDLTTWSLLVWESAIRTRLFTSYKDRVRVIMTLWTSWDRLVIGVDVIIIFTFVRYSL